MAMLDVTSTYRLRTGYEIPCLGFGTAGDQTDDYKMDAQVSLEANILALKAGYRHLDSARYYGSEASSGAAVSQFAGNRADIFVTSKSFENGYTETKEAIDSGLRDSGLGYFDLYLLHSPYGGPAARKAAWRAMVEAKKEGKVRSIGVSNYGIHHLEETEAYIAELEAELGKGHGGEISVGQWELHPWLMRPEIVDWCRKRNIIVEAYCPLVRGRRFGEPALKTLAEKYQKSPAQILIRWSLQKGFVPLPKSITPSRIELNIALYDFELTKDDLASLETEEYSPCTWDPAKSPLDN